MTPSKKFIGVKYHWIRELVDFGIIRLQHVAGLENHSDILTKPNPKSVFHPASKILLNEKPITARVANSIDQLLVSSGGVDYTQKIYRCKQAAQEWRSTLKRTKTFLSRNKPFEKAPPNYDLGILAAIARCQRAAWKSALAAWHRGTLDMQPCAVALKLIGFSFWFLRSQKLRAVLPISARTSKCHSLTYSKIRWFGQFNR